MHMKVLIAEDSQPIRERLVERLSQIPDVQVCEAVDTPDALRQFATFMPQVAVLDIRMPGGGGIEALGKIKSRRPDTTVIIMTNYPYAQYRKKCLEAGADFFFDKSTEFEQVPETIRNLLKNGNVETVAHHTAAAQLVAAKEELEKQSQRYRDMSILSLLHKPGDGGLPQAYDMWEKTFDAMPDMVAIFDPEHTIVRVNRVMAERLGVPAAELIGKKCFEYLHGTSCPVGGCPHEAMLTDRQEHTEQMYSNPLNSWFDVTVSPILDGDRIIGVIHIAHDSTQRKETEKYRDLGREILAVLNLPENSKHPIQSVLEVLKKRTGFDAVGIRLKDGKDFPYYVQDGFPADFLRTENPLVGSSEAGDVCRNPDGRISLKGACGRVLSGKTDPSNPRFTKGGSFWVNDGELLLDLPAADHEPLCHPCNTCIQQGYASIALIPIWAQSRIVGLIQLNDHRKDCFTLEAIELLEEIATHVGEALLRKQAEQTITDSELRYRQLFGSMQSGFALHEIICDDQGVPCDYRFLEVNRAFENLTGLEAKTIIGRTVKEVLPSTEEKWIRLYGEVALTGKSIQIDDFSSALDCHYSVSAYSPNPGQFATIFTDTSEQIAAVEAIRRARDAAEETSRTKTQFLANMSHELRTPLNAIIGFSEILADTPLTEEQLDYIQTIGTSGEALLTIINDLLDLSRIEMGKLSVKTEAFNVRAVIQISSALLAEFAAKKGIALSVDVAESVPEILMGDPARLQQVLINLINNALKFTTEGFVRLIVRSIPLPSGSRRVEFRIEDSGEGMDEATLARIFEPFQQGDNSSTREHGGAGLGLAICKNLVEMMGGSICVTSQKNQGSIFRFHLMDQAPEQVKRSLNEIRDQWRGKTICVWTDDPADTRIAEFLLERIGVMPRYAETLDNIYNRVSGDVSADAVLCNLDFPGLAERLLEFRSIRPEVPWIGFSNWTEPLDERIKPCFSAFIDRPLKAEPLYGVLMSLSEPGV
jgi:PAS domain S-box-containing protein